MDAKPYPTVVINGVVCRDYYHTYHDDPPPKEMTIDERWVEVRTTPYKPHRWNRVTCVCGAEFCVLWEWYDGPGGLSYCSRECLVRDMYRPRGCHAKRAGAAVTLQQCACCERQFAKRWRWPYEKTCSIRCHRVLTNSRQVNRLKNLKGKAREQACLRLSRELLKEARRFLRNGNRDLLQLRLRELQQMSNTPG